MRGKETSLASPLAFVVAVAIAGLTVAAEGGSQVPTAAMIPAGGLQFAANQNVRLRSQLLRISTGEVAMTYEMENTSSEPIEIRTSFPLPDLEMPTLVWESGVAVPIDSDPNFVGLWVRVDGQVVTPLLQQRATALGIDVTRELFTNNLPLFPFSFGLDERLNALPEATVAMLAKSGLVANISGRNRPMWTLRSTLHWMTMIPAGATVEVAASYRPIVGRKKFESEDLKRAASTYCFSAAEQAQLARRSGTERPVAVAESLLYLVPVNANLLGAPERTRIVVELPDENTIIATCHEGFRRTGPLTMEWNGQGIMLEDDLRVLFLR